MRVVRIASISSVSRITMKIAIKKTSCLAVCLRPYILVGVCTSSAEKIEKA